MERAIDVVRVQEYLRLFSPKEKEQMGESRFKEVEDLVMKIVKESELGSNGIIYPDPTCSKETKHIVVARLYNPGAT